MEKPTVRVLVVGGIVFAAVGAALVYSKGGLAAVNAPFQFGGFVPTDSGVTANTAAVTPEYGGQAFDLAHYTPPDLTAFEVAPNNPANVESPFDFAALISAITNNAKIASPTNAGGCNCTGGLSWVTTGTYSG